jgi:hypothetical protein
MGGGGEGVIYQLPLVGTFSDTEIVDYRSSFADQGNQTSVFRLHQTNGSLPFPFSVCSKKR